MDAIIYTSNTGTTAEYAALLGKNTGLPVRSLDNAKDIREGADVIYLGWLMAGTIEGYRKAAKRYNVRVVCGVGMGKSGSQVEDARKHNAVPPSVPVFTLQGGFYLNRLSGMYKFMMKTMMSTVGNKLKKKPDRTPEENDMLDLMFNGGSRVSEAYLDGVLGWLKANA